MVKYLKHKFIDGSHVHQNAHHLIDVGLFLFMGMESKAKRGLHEVDKINNRQGHYHTAQETDGSGTVGS